MAKSEVMTPAERRKLIEAPISINIIGRSHGWSGTCVADDSRIYRKYTPFTYANYVNRGKVAAAFG